MTLETERALINVNNVSVPGFFRNGAFISEVPINTFILYRSGSFATNQIKTFLVEAPCTPKTIVILDTTNNNTYTFVVTTTELIIYTIVFSAAQVTIHGNTKIINFPLIVLDKGTRVSLQVSNAIQGVALFANFAYNVEIKEF